MRIAKSRKASKGVKDAIEALKPHKIKKIAKKQSKILTTIKSKNTPSSAPQSSRNDTDLTHNTRGDHSSKKASVKVKTSPTPSKPSKKLALANKKAQKVAKKIVNNSKSQKEQEEAVNLMMAAIQQLSASIKKATSNQKKLAPILKQVATSKEQHSTKKTKQAATKQELASKAVNQVAAKVVKVAEQAAANLSVGKVSQVNAVLKTVKSTPKSVKKASQKKNSKVQKSVVNAASSQSASTKGKQQQDQPQRKSRRDHKPSYKALSSKESTKRSKSSSSTSTVSPKAIRQRAPIPASPIQILKKVIRKVPVTTVEQKSKVLIPKNVKIAKILKKKQQKQKATPTVNTSATHTIVAPLHTSVIVPVAKHDSAQKVVAPVVKQNVQNANQKTVQKNKNKSKSPSNIQAQKRRSRSRSANFSYKQLTKSPDFRQSSNTPKPSQPVHKSSPSTPSQKNKSKSPSSRTIPVVPAIVKVVSHSTQNHASGDTKTKSVQQAKQAKVTNSSSIAQVKVQAKTPKIQVSVQQAQQVPLVIAPVAPVVVPQKKSGSVVNISSSKKVSQIQPAPQQQKSKSIWALSNRQKDNNNKDIGSGNGRLKNLERIFNQLGLKKRIVKQKVATPTASSKVKKSKKQATGAKKSTK